MSVTVSSLLCGACCLCHCSMVLFAHKTGALCVLVLLSTEPSVAVISDAGLTNLVDSSKKQTLLHEFSDRICYAKTENAR